MTRAERGCSWATLALGLFALAVALAYHQTVDGDLC